MATKSSIMDTNSYSDDYVSLLSATTKDMISRREKWMGGAYRLFYRKPVNLVRGKGQYLWDAEGNKYLDMYNNVAGIIVSREAYHGTSALTSGCSPALGSEQPLLPNVRLIDTPDYYRHGGTPEKFTAWYSGEMQKKIDELAAAGYKFSCFLADSIFSSDGVHPDPVGFLKAASGVGDR